MSHITRCPACKSGDICLHEQFIAFKSAYSFRCLDCKAESACTDTIQGAKVLWNKWARINMSAEEKREEKNALGKEYYHANKERISVQRKTVYDCMSDAEKAECKRIEKLKRRYRSLSK